MVDCGRRWQSTNGEWRGFRPQSKPKAQTDPYPGVGYVRFCKLHSCGSQRSTVSLLEVINVRMIAELLQVLWVVGFFLPAFELDHKVLTCLDANYQIEFARNGRYRTSPGIVQDIIINTG